MARVTNPPQCWDIFFWLKKWEVTTRHLLAVQACHQCAPMVCHKDSPHPSRTRWDVGSSKVRLAVVKEWEDFNRFQMVSGVKFHDFRWLLVFFTVFFILSSIAKISHTLILSWHFHPTHPLYLQFYTSAAYPTSPTTEDWETMRRVLLREAFASSRVAQARPIIEAEATALVAQLTERLGTPVAARPVLRRSFTRFLLKWALSLEGEEVLKLEALVEEEGGLEIQFFEGQQVRFSVCCSSFFRYTSFITINTIYIILYIYLFFLDSCQGLMEKMLEGMGYFDQSRGDSHGFLGIAVTSRCFGRLATHPTRTHPAPALRAGPASHSLPERGFLGCLVGGTKETWIWRWFDHWNLSISHHCGYQHCCYSIGMAASFVGTRSKCPGTRKEWWRLFGCLHPRGTSFEDTFVYSTTLFRRHPGGWLQGENWQFVVTRFLQVGTWRHLMGLSRRLSSWAFLREGAFLPSIQTWYSIATLSLQQAFWICQVFAFWIGCTFLSWCSVGHGTTPEFHGETADITMASGKSNRWLVRGLFLHIDASQSCQIDFRLGRKVGHWGKANVQGIHGMSLHQFHISYASEASWSFYCSLG